MGEVLAVTEVATGKRFALKRLHSGADARHAMALSREYHRLASLKHPHIVQAFDFGMSEGTPYYTMELLSGSDLESLAPLPWPEVVSILRDIAGALSTLHARRLVHRDVSGRNVWRTSEGVVKLIDFGTMITFGVANQLAGTLPYLAPEATRTRLLDQRSDLYSLGALGYQLLTGRQAFPARSLADLEQYWAARPPSVRAVLAALSRLDLPPVPEALEHVLDALMAADPDARPATAADVLERLTGLLPDDDAKPAQAITGSMSGAAFSGRSLERTRFLDLLRGAMDGRGSSALLVGPRGIGRTRLLEELAIEARIAGAVVVSSSAEEGRGAFAIAQRALLAMLEAAPQEARAAAAPLAPVLGHLSEEVRQALAIDASSLEKIPLLLGEARVRMQSALYALFREVAAHKPLVLLVDDLHAVDQASIAFLTALARDAGDRKLLVLATVRTEEERGWPVAVKPFADRAQTLSLSGLSLEETEEMLRSVYGEAPQLPRTSAFLWEKSEGNPGRLTDLCEFLQQTEKIRWADGLWVMPQETAELTVPASLVLLDEARLRRLHEDERRLAETLSVLQDAIPLEVCAKMSPLAPEQTFGALTRLCEAGVLIHGADGYCFRTAELRRHLAESLSPEAAQRAHEAAAAALLGTSAPGMPQRLTAGVHLLRGGALRRGAELVQRAVLEAADEMTEEHLRLAPLADEAYARCLELSLSPQERLGLLSFLASAGYFIDRKFGQKYGDEALACAQQVCGMDIAHKLRRWIGKRLALLVSLIVAGARLRKLQRKNALVPDLKSSLTMLMTTAGALSGMHTLCMARDKVLECVRAIEPLTALGRDHVATFVYKFSLGCADMLSYRIGETCTLWQELVSRLEDPRPIASMAEPTRLYYRAACLYCWGGADIWGAGSRTLELADRLEAQPVKVYQVSADQLRALYFAQRGKMAEANRHRGRVEMRALQRGITWQVEIWEPASTVSIAARQGDLIALKRAAGQLRHLAVSAPALRDYVDTARATYLMHRRHYAEAVEVFEKLLARHPKEAVGYPNIVGALAQAYNALGRHADAERIASEMIARLSPIDLTMAALTLRVQIELAIAEAGLGRVQGAAQRLDALLGMHEPDQGPLTLGALYDARARVALTAKDERGAERYFSEMERWYRITECPSLIQYCDRIARRRSQGDIMALENAWGTSTVTTGGSYYLADITSTLGKMLESTTASRWVLCCPGPANDQHTVQASTESVDQSVVSWLEDRIRTSNEDMNDTLDTEDAATVDDDAIVLDGQRWISAILLDETGNVLGAVALCNAAQRPPLPLLQTLGGQLKRTHRSTFATAY